MLRKGKAKYINNMGTKNILRIPNTKHKSHPTEKPTELINVIINNSSNENDIILDPLMGSGTTGVACLESNRKFVGCEIDKKYYEIAKNRIIDK